MTNPELYCTTVMAMGLIAILVELLLGFSTAFDLVVIGSALIIGGASGYFANSLSVALVVSSVLAFLYIALGRKYLQTKLQVQDFPSNIDAMHGKKGKVTSHIQRNHTYKVKIEGNEWSASSETKLEIGDMIELVKAEGVILEVKKI